jgi:chromosome partitioning protein
MSDRRGDVHHPWRHGNVSSRSDMIIAVLNRKGGVGKSASVAHLSRELAQEVGKRSKRGGDGRKPVLIIDVDSQGHAGKHLGIEPNGQPNLGNVLFDNLPAREALVPTNIDDVWIIRGSRTLRDLDFSIGVQVGEEIARGVPVEQRLDPYNILKEALAPLREEFQMILVDCGPSAGLLHMCVFALADYLVIPSEADAGAIEGIVDLMEDIAEAQELTGSRIELLGVVFTKVSGFTVEHRANMQELRDNLGGLVFDAHVRAATRMREAWRERMLITHYDPRSGVSDDYRAVAREIMKRVHNARKDS